MFKNLHHHSLSPKLSRQRDEPEAKSWLYVHPPFVLSWKNSSGFLVAFCQHCCYCYFSLQGDFLTQPVHTKGVCLLCSAASAGAFPPWLREGSEETGTWYFSSLSARGTSIGYRVYGAAFARAGFRWLFAAQAAPGQKCWPVHNITYLVAPETGSVFSARRGEGIRFMKR